MIEPITNHRITWLARRVLVPWVQGERLAGDGLEIGAGSGAIAAHLQSVFPAPRMTVTHYDTDRAQAA